MSFILLRLSAIILDDTFQHDDSNYQNTKTVSCPIAEDIKKVFHSTDFIENEMFLDFSSFKSVINRNYIGK